MKKNKETIDGRAYKYGIQTLGSEELVLYFIHRIKNFLSKNAVISRYELNHLLCGTGKGTIRFDPVLIDLIENENFHELTTDIEHLTTADHTFFCARHLDEQFLESIVKAKINLIQSIKRDFSNMQLKERIIEIVKNTMDPSTDVIGEKILSNSVQVSVIINNLKFLIRYITDDQWIYPYSNEIWSLYEESCQQSGFPVLIAPRIQSICYSMFKIIGMLGFKPLEIYIFKNTLKQLDNFMKTFGTTIELAPESSVSFRDDINQCYDFRPGFLTAIEEDIYNGNNALRYFIDNVLKNIINSNKHVTFTEARKNLQCKLTEDEYNTANLAVFSKILKLLSENKLSDYINKWYTTRMAIIENFKNVTHH